MLSVRKEVMLGAFFLPWSPAPPYTPPPPFLSPYSPRPPHHSFPTHQNHQHHQSPSFLSLNQNPRSTSPNQNSLSSPSPHFSQTHFPLHQIPMMTAHPLKITIICFASLFVTKTLNSLRQSTPLLSSEKNEQHCPTLSFPPTSSWVS